MVFSLRSTLGQLQNTAMFFRLTLILRGQISYAALRGRPRPRIRLEPTQAEFDRMQREVTEDQRRLSRHVLKIQASNKNSTEMQELGMPISSDNATTVLPPQNAGQSNYLEYVGIVAQAILAHREPASMAAKISRWCDFNWQAVDIVQIGLGTNQTFIQKDSYFIQGLLEGTDEHGHKRLTGIGVDPVVECVKGLYRHRRRSGKVALIAGAVARESGTRRIFGLPWDLPKAVESVMRRLLIPPEVQAEVRTQLEYLKNMSRLDAPHPRYKASVDCIPALVRRQLFKEGRKLM